MAEYYKTLDDVVAAVKTKYDSAAKAKINSYNADVDKATAVATQNAATAEETTKKGYEDVFHKNRLNQIINEEKTKERMANLGLIDSGLNRTQQTAIQLQAANADAAAIRNRQAEIDEIRRGITEFTAQQEAKKSDYARETNDLAHQNMMSEATSIWNTQLENQQKAAEAKQEALNQLITTLSNTELTHPQRVAAYKTYSDIYGFDNAEQANNIAERYGIGSVNNGVLEEYNEPMYTLRKNGDFTYDVIDSSGKTIKNIDYRNITSLPKTQIEKIKNLEKNASITTKDLNLNEYDFDLFKKDIENMKSGRNYNWFEQFIVDFTKDYKTQKNRG